MLDERFALRQVWTIREAVVAPEWLVIREEELGYSYALSNAPAATAPQRLVDWKCRRFGIECANQDAKSELGWADFRAQKFPAWEHHLALTILAAWFVAQTKVDWAERYARDGTLVEQLDVPSLPALSVANVRELLQAVLPLQELSPEEARRLVVKHLVERARSTRSRQKAKLRERGPT